MEESTAPIEMAVVVPTLNEAQNISRLLDGIMQADARLHAVVVDDGSSDGTDRVVEDKAREYSGRIHLIERGKKMGYASAIQDGMRFALKRGATRVLQMDADFSHNPQRLPALMEKSESEDLDLVIGSRYIPGGGTENWGLDRKILSGGANLLVRTLLGLKVRDCTGGFRCWKRELIEKAGVLDLKVEGYAFLFITMDRCTRLKAKVGEVPIIFVDREFGKSKMSRRIIMEAMRVLFRLWLARLKFKRRDPKPK
jgi:dolichol-phosphate mannosyltransferase